MICTGVLLAACNGGKQDPVDPVDPQPEPQTMELTFVVPEMPVDAPAGFKTAWEAGDQIVIHGEYAASQVTVTLEAGDISADGKSATKTVSGLYPYEREDCESTLYASYPAAAVNNLKHCFFYSGFNPVNQQLMAACNNGTTFQFENLSSIVTFVVEGDFDAVGFTARNDIRIGGDRYQVKITDDEVNLRQYLENASTTVISSDLVADGKTVNVMYIHGGLALEAGYILSFYKDGKATKSTKDKNQMTLKTGEMLTLGDVTDKLVNPADDIDPGLATSIDTKPANCYIIEEPGLYKFMPAMGNTDDTFVGITEAEIVWETICTADPLEPRTVISGITFDAETGYVCFMVPEPIVPGNALLAVKNSKHEILWSWHIWIPETPITEVEGAIFAGKKALSRNIGALVDATMDAEASSRSFGMLYQFGRKDPFPGLAGIGSETPVTVAGTQITKEEGPIDFVESRKYPTIIYYKDKADWESGGDPSTVWEVESTKTVYDPCPPGYRLPPRDKNYGTWSGNSIQSQSYFKEDLEKGVFQIGKLVFPLAGQIAAADGVLKKAGTNAIVWSNHYDSGTVNGYGYDHAEFRNHGVVRSNGGSLRCIQEL